jgi:hypothetical protein
VRGAWHVGVQPAVAAGFQLGARGGEQADGAVGVVLLGGDGRQGLKVVGRACFVAGLGRDGQSLLQVSCSVGQVALRLAGQCQVVERDEDGDPVLRPAGHGQAIGEQPRRCTAVCLAEPDLAEEVIREGDGQQLLKVVVPGELPVAELLR